MYWTFPKSTVPVWPQQGGKGANLGELFRIPGIAVPAGFVVTTGAYRDFVYSSKEFPSLMRALAQIKLESLDELKMAAANLRTHLENLAIPAPIRREILQAWQKQDSHDAYAIRSSATAEDLPGASFAGQQDTFLNIRGIVEIFDSVRCCWASLFTDRAIIYRRQNGFHDQDLALAVVVQRMVFPEASGIMFTADPVTGNRKVDSIDASFGLGEALVSGIVSADLYQVKEEQLLTKRIARKKMAVYAQAEGGTARVELSGEQQTVPALTDEQIFQLARIGRTIEGHFGTAQDIEWGLIGGDIFILQSRPITTLYPVPPASSDQIHLFISVGHQQMMTEAMKPLGISVFRTLVPWGKSMSLAESHLLQEAGSRLYFDLNPVLKYRQIRKRLPGMLLGVDEVLSRTVQEFIAGKELRYATESGKKVEFSLIKAAFPTAFAILKNILYREHHHVIAEINRFMADQVEANREKLQVVSGEDRIVRIQEILANMLPSGFSMIFQYVGAAMITYKLIETLSQKWLGDAAELGGISKSPPGNVTTAMSLALGDLADTVRDHPAVIAYLRQADNATFFSGMDVLPDGSGIHSAFAAFLERYGMRGTGEIDITRPRWREVPTQLVPAILSHIQGNQPGQHRREFRTGQTEAEAAATRLLERLRQTPRGFLKARRMQHLIKVYRALIGIREHPKYFMVQNLDLVKQAILEEADQLKAAGILKDPEDIFWFSLSEIKTIIAAQWVDQNQISLRKAKFQHDAKLSPPRAITSEGEIITPKPKGDVPPGALAGSPVSAGIIEGRARVIRKLEEARINKGDILVAPYTDPAWTPLFSLAAGLVTEVGGLMTHGAVVAREYGLPAVVGVDLATRKIRDGQLIRVDGSQGVIELLE